MTQPFSLHLQGKSSNNISIIPICTRMFVDGQEELHTCPHCSTMQRSEEKSTTPKTLIFAGSRQLLQSTDFPMAFPLNNTVCQQKHTNVEHPTQNTYYTTLTNLTSKFYTSKHGHSKNGRLRKTPKNALLTFWKNIYDNCLKQNTPNPNILYPVFSIILYPFAYTRPYLQEKQHTMYNSYTWMKDRKSDFIRSTSWWDYSNILPTQSPLSVDDVVTPLL